MLSHGKVEYGLVVRDVGRICSMQEPGFTAESGRSLEKEMEPTCILPENFIDREAWRATNHRVATNWTWLSNWYTQLTTEPITYSRTQKVSKIDLCQMACSEFHQGNDFWKGQYFSYFLLPLTFKYDLVLNWGGLYLEKKSSIASDPPRTCALGRSALSFPCQW